MFIIGRFELSNYDALMSVLRVPILYASMLESLCQLWPGHVTFNTPCSSLDFKVFSFSVSDSDKPKMRIEDLILSRSSFSTVFSTKSNLSRCRSQIYCNASMSKCSVSLSTFKLCTSSSKVRTAFSSLYCFSSRLSTRNLTQ